MRRFFALSVALAGCNASAIDLDLVLPRDGQALLADVACYRLEARRGGETRLVVDTEMRALGFEGLTPGLYELQLEAVAEPLDVTACTGGDVRARASTSGVHIDSNRRARVPLLVLPIDRPVTLDVPEWVEDWFEGRTNLAAAVARDAGGVPRVVFAGGLTEAGPSAEVLLYEPREARFTQLPDLACARVGPGAVVVGAPGAPEQVLLAATRDWGDDEACTRALGVDEPAVTSMGSAELLNPVSGFTVLSRLPVPVAAPRLVRDGAGAWLIGQPAREEAMDQHYAPDLGEGDGEEWHRNPRPDISLPEEGGALSSIFPEGGPPFLVAGGRIGPLPYTSMKLLRPAPDEDRLLTCADTAAPLWGENLVVTPTRNGDVLFAGETPDGGGAWVRQTFEAGPACAVRPDSLMGTLTTGRRRALATPLGGGRVLLSGGDEAGTMEIFLPDLGNTLPLGPGSGAREGHAAVLLEDGSVLIAGGGPRTVDALLPGTDRAGQLHWDHVADPAPALDVLVVVSNHEEARAVRRLLRAGGAGGPRGLAASIRPLVSAFEITNDAEVNVVVTTGDMRCDDRRPGNGGSPQLCEGAPDKVSALNCALDRIDEAGACVAQELMRALVQATANFEGGHDPLHTERPLVVLLAAPRDDCSSATGAVFLSSPGDPPLERRCAVAKDLLDPVRVAETIAALRGDESRISVMTFGGPDEEPTEDDAESCPGVRPTPRLAAFARTFGVSGRHINLCDAGVGSSPLEWFGALVEGRIGRSICLPHAPQSSGGAPNCVVTYDRDDPVRGAEAIRIPTGADGWYVNEDPEGCDELVVSPRLELPIGAPVGYACQ